MNASLKLSTPSIPPLKAYSIFFAKLKILVENDISIQEAYRWVVFTREDSPDVSLSINKLVSWVLGKIRWALWWEKTNSLKNTTSERVRRYLWGYNGDIVDFDNQYTEDIALLNEIEKFTLLGVPFDIIRFYIPKNLTIKNSPDLAHEVFRKMKPIFIAKGKMMRTRWTTEFL